MLEVALIGNCHAPDLARIIETRQTGAVVHGHFVQSRPYAEDPAFDRLSSADVIFAMSHLREHIDEAGLKPSARVFTIPSINCAVLHPDATYVFSPEGAVHGPLGPLQSSLIYWAWLNGLAPHEAEELFCDPVYEAVGHYVSDDASRDMIDRAAKTDIPLDDLWPKWIAAGAFLHAPNHPRIDVMVDLADRIMALATLVPSARPEVVDKLALNARWPVFPEIAKRLGTDCGSYDFSRGTSEGHPNERLSLRQFIEASYKAFEPHDPATLKCNLYRFDRFPADLVEIARQRQLSAA